MDDNLILGGTGKTGRRVAERLRAAGRPVRTAARARADVTFDLAKPETWAPALDGASAVYLVEPDLGAASVDGSRRIPAFVTAATAAGARRLVLLTAGGADYDGHPLKPAETAVRGSGVGWTILRPTWFAQNFSEDSWRPGILSGSLVLPTGDGRTPFIDAEDIAEIAAEALTQDRHHGQTYLLTGPRAISFGEATDLIAKATGRAIQHTDVEPEAYIEGQIAVGVPPDVARMLTSVLTAIRDGHDSALADGVERALDRPPTPFEDYVTRTAASGGWD
ncbi:MULTISPECIES: NAD(P)H-binding protein [unclassified Pseudofrankia]|uniref:NAD(P)H-binding protein n=1 Tax=unclassified Pseudofrankia TaxID=2994372 RepID=UPI0008D9301F|nr:MULTISPECIES: NAD(P)H-binding protein [unclassified Pseudofrankia]MDT3442569.1 NAD(P)H-binding protein [Pseudofrankia sp. BMG5.37]OHV71775.1 NmrA family transcriptional regulator [Pseudofrankia sp. BMG5.36]